METLSKTQSATKLVEDINSNLQEISSQVEVEVTDSATSLVSTLNTALGVNTLDASDDAGTFVAALNTAFEDAVASSWPSGIAEFNSAKYGAEMDDTVTKVNALKNDADFIMLVSTDIHYEQNLKTTVGNDSNVPLNARSGNRYIPTHNDTFSQMMSNHCEFLRRANIASNNIKVDAIACLGDFFDGMRVGYVKDGETVLSAHDACAEYIGIMTSKYKALSTAYQVPLLFAVGNHDNNYDAGEGVPLSASEVSEIFLQNVVDSDNGVTWENTDKLDYYRDFGSIRIVVLYCNYRTYPSTNDAKFWLYTAESVNFLKAATSSESLNGKKAIVLCHIRPYNDTENKNGQRSELYSYLEGNDNILAMFSGHSHFDGVYGFPIPNIITTCCRDDDEAHPNDNKDLWDVVCVNTKVHVINCIRINGGDVYDGDNLIYRSQRDRVLHYEQIEKNSGESVTFTASPKDGEVLSSFSIVGSSSLYGNSASRSYDTATDFVDRVQDGNSYTVTVKQDVQVPRIQHIAVCASYKRQDNDVPTRLEYWFIKIPKTT